MSTDTTVAHVEYVVPDPGRLLDPIGFLIDVLSEPMNMGLMTVGGVMTIGVLVGYLYVYESAPLDAAILRESLTGRRDLPPVVASTQRRAPALTSGLRRVFHQSGRHGSERSGRRRPDPTVSRRDRLFPSVRDRDTSGGHRRTARLRERDSRCRPQLLLASEYLGGFLAIVLLGPSQPSVDRLLARLAEADGTHYDRIPSMRTSGPRPIDTSTHTRSTRRRYSGSDWGSISSTWDCSTILQSSQVLAVVERYHLTSVVPVDPGLWVVGAGTTELALGVALIVGLFTRGVAAITFGTFTLTLFALPGDPVLAHVSLFGLATALLITGSGRIAFDNL